MLFADKDCFPSFSQFGCSLFPFLAQLSWLEAPGQCQTAVGRVGALISSCSVRKSFQSFPTGYDTGCTDLSMKTPVHMNRSYRTVYMHEMDLLIFCIF